MSETEVGRELVDVSTGERLPATVENAAAVLLAARDMKRRLDDHIRDAEAFLADESARQGTKTFHTAWGDIVLAGGISTVYEGNELANALRAAGCPEERIEEVVRTEVTYKVDRRILKQLTGANPAYAAAAAAVAQEVESSLRASVKASPKARGRRTA